jgi:hypothetical protein
VVVAVVLFPHGSAAAFVPVGLDVPTVFVHGCSCVGQILGMEKGGFRRRLVCLI